ncbi:MAG: transposase, partial [Planctomycetota bacterium]
MDQGALQLGLFDQRNLFEFRHPDHPDERFVACRNPDLAEHRRHKRVALLEATTAKLAKIRDRVDAGRLRGKAEIGVR